LDDVELHPRLLARSIQVWERSSPDLDGHALCQSRQRTANELGQCRARYLELLRQFVEASARQIDGADRPEYVLRRANYADCNDLFDGWISFDANSNAVVVVGYDGARQYRVSGGRNRFAAPPNVARFGERSKQTVYLVAGERSGTISDDAVGNQVAIFGCDRSAPSGTDNRHQRFTERLGTVGVHQ
jgi:hypothetical protein